jgi:HTH-type transcriptional regulator/antitoxin HigA
MIAQTYRNKADADHYLDLIKAFPLRPIRSEREHDAAIAVLDKLVTRDENLLDAGERDYIEALTLLAGAYQTSHHKIDTSGVPPIDSLRSLMLDHGMRAADLGRILGSSGLASDILSGKRQISKAHARKLAERFKVDGGLFL